MMAAKGYKCVGNGFSTLNRGQIGSSEGLTFPDLPNFFGKVKLSTSTIRIAGILSGNKSFLSGGMLVHVDMANRASRGTHGRSGPIGLSREKECFLRMCHGGSIYGCFGLRESKEWAGKFPGNEPLDLQSNGVIVLFLCT